MGREVGTIAMTAGIAMAITAFPGLIGGHVLLTSIGWAGVIGAAVGALGVLLTPKSQSTRQSTDAIVTSSIRTTPVPLVFGKGRLGGNWLCLGGFFRHKDGHDGTPGARVYQAHAYLGLCEGPIQSAGNCYLDGQPIQNVIKDSGFGEPDPKWKKPKPTATSTVPGVTQATTAGHLDTTASGPAAAVTAKEPEAPLVSSYYQITPVLGAKRGAVPKWLRDKSQQAYYGFAVADPVPWRNTAYLICAVDVGGTSHLPQITVDVVGPDLSIQRRGKNADTACADRATYVMYDAWTESFYAVLTAASRPSPLGMICVPREGGLASQTQPPSGVANIARGWYLGRHDVLVMQDPASPDLFYVGYWGIAPASSDWEKVRPDPSYATAMDAFHLDELNGILHSVHKGAVNYYIMRWNLLTGFVERLDTDRPISAAIRLMLLWPDNNAYVLAGSDGYTYFIDIPTGRTYHRTSKLQTTTAVGLCVCGSLIGVISPASVIYYDPLLQRVEAGSYYNPNTKAATAGYGFAAATLDTGALGGIVFAAQNTWTGHVTISKVVGGQLAYVNFIPSILDETTDNPRSDWCRDWSVKQYNQWALHALEGRRSVAAPLWSIMVDEPRVDSGRWGAGFRRDWFCLSSFEALHAYCVGAMRFPFGPDRMRYQERYKLDLVVDSERPLADVVVNDMLMAVNGFRCIVNGQLHVSPQRNAMAVNWHFADCQITADSAQMQIQGRSASANRIRVDFVDTDDNYRHSYGEASDEFDINARGRTTSTTISAMGIGRKGQARLIAQQVLDAVAANQRTIKFKTFWLGYILTPGDGIEITHTGLGLVAQKARIVSISEEDKGEVEITASEHRCVRHKIKSYQPAPLVNDWRGCDALERSAEARLGYLAYPMHLTVVEYADKPRLAPLAALPPNSIAGKLIRVDYKYADEHNWTTLGRSESCIGGFVRYGISATAASVFFDGVHGDEDEDLKEKAIQLVMATHETLGVQIARAAGDELMTCEQYDLDNQAFRRLTRDYPQSWQPAAKTLDHVYTVSGVRDDECIDYAAFYPARVISTLALADVWIAADQVPRLPFYFFLAATGVCYSIDGTDLPRTTGIGTKYADWREVASPSSSPCTGCTTPPTGTIGLSTTITGSKTVRLAWTDLAGEVGWRVWRKQWANGTWTLASTLAANTITYTDTVPSLGDWYYYVEAYNACGSTLSLVDGETVSS